MKKIYYAIPLAIVLIILAAKPYVTNTVGSEEGIQFVSGSWAEMLVKSKKEHKPIFLDASTSWCGWCKKLKSTSFADKEVAAYFNKNYINYEIDAEHGEGVMLAKKYRINSYPTLMFIDANEKSLMFSEGYLTAADLLKLGKQVREKQK
jgi:thioredoxin-related protein